MSKEELNKILALRKKLHEYNYEYYVNSRSLISDFEFDRKLKELEKLENENPEFDDPMSPTKRVGSDITTEFSQIKHKFFSSSFMFLLNRYI